MKKRKVTPKQAPDPMKIVGHDDEDGPIPQWLVDICDQGRPDFKAGRYTYAVRDGKYVGQR